MYCMQNIFFLSNAYVTHFNSQANERSQRAVWGEPAHPRLERCCEPVRSSAKMRSHEERLDETTFEKTARPVLDEIPEARLRVRLGFKQTHNRTRPARKRGGREGSVQNARPVLKPDRASCCTQKKHIHVLPGCTFTNQRGHVTRTAVATSSENTNVEHDLSRLSRTRKTVRRHCW